MAAAPPAQRSAFERESQARARHHVRSQTWYRPGMPWPTTTIHLPPDDETPVPTAIRSHVPDIELTPADAEIVASLSASLPASSPALCASSSASSAPELYRPGAWRSLAMSYMMRRMSDPPPWAARDSGADSQPPSGEVPVREPWGPAR
jgi:hypothetical protein